ncbi:hypothetical protein [Sporosarcina sp. FSL K6-1508]
MHRVMTVWLEPRYPWQQFGSSMEQQYVVESQYEYRLAPRLVS